MKTDLADSLLNRLLPEKLLNDRQHVFGNPDKAARFAKLSKQSFKEKLEKLNRKVDFAELKRIQGLYRAKRRHNSLEPLHSDPTSPSKSRQRLGHDDDNKPRLVQRSFSVIKHRRIQSKRITEHSTGPLRSKYSSSPPRALKPRKTGSKERLDRLISKCNDFPKTLKVVERRLYKDCSYEPLKFLLNESERSLNYPQAIPLKDAVRIRRKEEKDNQDNFMMPAITERFRQDSYNLSEKIGKMRRRRPLKSRQSASYSRLHRQRREITSPESSN
jgi:hypothetical protein